MKTTLEIPYSVFRRAKAKCAENRIPLRQFTSEAVAEKLEAECQSGTKARTQLAGRVAPLAQGERANQQAQ
jgi:hypothetical protein